tara:strand:- start:723 stop:1298 length:576 start_codon:yes stop_codon:yes gene_type:complete
MRSEAVGDSAECFYDLQDEYCGEQCPSMPHKILIDELVRYLSGDQLQDFCDDFRRHHMDGMEESAVTELKKLAGLDEKMGTGTDVPPGGFPKYKKLPGMGTGTDVPPGGFPKREFPMPGTDDIDILDNPGKDLGTKVPPMFGKDRLDRLEFGRPDPAEMPKVPTQDDRIKDMIRRARKQMDNDRLLKSKYR